MESGVTRVNGTSLYYEVAGSGPTVVLLHGAMLDRRLWDDQFAALAAHYRVLRYDLRGWGRSAPANVRFAHHEDLGALLRQLGVQHAALVGLSGGGRIAVDFTLAHPERVDALVLAGPGVSGWTWRDDGDSTWLVHARAALARRDSVGVALSWLESDYMRPAMRDPALAARLRAIAADNVAFWMWRVRVHDLERPADPPALGRLAELRAPMLLVLGAEDVPDVRRIVDSLATRVPRARRVVYPGTGHVVNMERPRRFTTDVLTFLVGAVPAAAP